MHSILKCQRVLLTKPIIPNTNIKQCKALKGHIAQLGTASSGSFVSLQGEKHPIFKHLLITLLSQSMSYSWFSVVSVGISIYRTAPFH